MTNPTMTRMIITTTKMSMTNIQGGERLREGFTAVFKILRNLIESVPGLMIMDLPPLLMVQGVVGDVDEVGEEDSSLRPNMDPSSLKILEDLMTGLRGLKGGQLLRQEKMNMDSLWVNLIHPLQGGLGAHIPLPITMIIPMIANPDPPSVAGEEEDLGEVLLVGVDF